MKIAIVNHYSSAGGGARYSRALVKALAGKYPDAEIGFFNDAKMIKRDSLFSLFKDIPNIKIIPLSNANRFNVNNDKKSNLKKESIKQFVKKNLKKIRLVVNFYNFLKHKILKVETEWSMFQFSPGVIKELEKYDVIHIAWHYFIEPYKFTKPVVFTFHDLNYKHPFGNFSSEVVKTVERQILGWLSIAKKIIVSTKFIKGEVGKYYPTYENKAEVIYLTTFNLTEDSNNKILEVINKYKVPRNFILSPSNTSLHKNLMSLMKAVGALKKDGLSIPLVLTGFGTENLAFLKKGLEVKEHSFPQKIFTEYQKIIDDFDLKIGKDIFPLGYISDEDIDNLIKGARLVVSSSLYEAGSGPGVDAWHAGTPVAFSNIQPFLEQLDFLGTKAWTFDPNNFKDIANVLKKVWQNRDKAQDMAKISKEAIDRYTWDNVAEKYYEVYKKALKK